MRNQLSPLLFPGETIMNMIAAIVRIIPITTFTVMLSPKAIAPTRIAVTGPRQRTAPALPPDKLNI